MFEFSCLNSGDALYFVNSSSQSVVDIGGRLPVTGRHSVILRLVLISNEALIDMLPMYNIPRLGQSCQTSEYDDTKDTGRAAK